MVEGSGSLFENARCGEQLRVPPLSGFSRPGPYARLSVETAYRTRATNSGGPLVDLKPAALSRYLTDADATEDSGAEALQRRDIRRSLIRRVLLRGAVCGTWARHAGATRPIDCNPDCNIVLFPEVSSNFAA
jgi:hypothetical protein